VVEFGGVDCGVDGVVFSLTWLNYLYFSLTKEYTSDELCELNY